MTDGTRLAATFALAFATVIVATPLARKLAIATSFYDIPTGYKVHRWPTPYLGGAAVVAGLVTAALTFGLEGAHLGAVLGTAGVLFVVGTLDDRRGLGIGIRLLIQGMAAIVLWEAGAGWELFGSDAANLATTLLWVVGLINGFNLMDNLDGATCTVAALSGAGAGLVALDQGNAAMAVLGFAVAGACAGFLPYNLTRPAKIFLGDGGSMPVGLVIAATVMGTPHADGGFATILVAVPLVGLVTFDTTLVVISRWRRGVTVLTGGRDHLSHRLVQQLGTTRRVAFVLALSQAFLCSIAIVLYQLSGEALMAGALAYVGLGVAALVFFESGSMSRLVRESS